MEHRLDCGIAEAMLKLALPFPEKRFRISNALFRPLS